MATNARKKRPSGQQTPAGLLASAARTVGTVAGGENRLMPSKRCYQLPYVHRLCSKCGRLSVSVHVPIEHVGYFCERCCPACSQKPAPPKGE
jgi:hypothetical protein